MTFLRSEKHFSAVNLNSNNSDSEFTSLSNGMINRIMTLKILICVNSPEITDINPGVYFCVANVRNHIYTTIL